MIKLQFKLPQTLISRGFTRRTALHLSIDLQGFDRVKEHYLSTVISCSSMPSTYTESPVASDTYTYFKEGWALPVRKFNRFNYN